MKQTSLNFGALKDTIYKFSNKELVSEGKNVTVLNAFLNEISDNPKLRIQYLVYKNLTSGHYKKEVMAERYINENLKLMGSLTWNDILDTNRDLRKKLLENCHVEGTTDRQSLYEAIHTLIKSVTLKGFSDIDASQDAFDVVMENLLKDKAVVQESQEEEFPKLASPSFITQLAVNEFNKRYTHLDENERNLLRILLSPADNKKNHLIDLKEESLNVIENALLENVDEETSVALNKFKDKISSINENSISDDDINEAIINITELKSTLDESE